MKASAAQGKRAGSSRDRRQVLLICLLLALAVAVVYGPVRRFQFLNYDDQDYVTENKFVRQGLSWEMVNWAFSRSYSSNWHPLTWISHALDWRLYGPNAGGHHLTNVLFHGLNTLLLFLVFKRLTGALWRSALVAALFALHPLHVESVAWVSERKDVLSTFFALLSIWAYAWHGETSPVSSLKSNPQGPKATVHSSRFKVQCPNPPSAIIHPPPSFFYLLSLLLFACSLMSKPMLVTLPFVLLLLDYWPLRRFNLSTTHRSVSEARHGLWGAANPSLRLVGEKLPFFALAIGSCVMTVWAQKTGGAVRSLAEISLGLRLENALVSYLLYVRRMFWPSDLAVFYPHPKAIALGQAGGAALVLGVASWLVMRRARKQPWLSVGWLWYLGTLVPVLGLVQVGWLSGADRYTYIPLIGLFMMLAWGGADWAQERRWAQVAVIAAGVSALAACAALSCQQVQFWRDSRTLFNRALQVTDDNYVAHQCLGMALGEDGELGAAALHLKEALRIEPDFPAAENNLGTVLLKEDRLEEAATHYRRAIALRPENGGAHENLGLVYAREGKRDEALAEFERALEIEPARPVLHFHAYLILASQNRMAEGIAHLEQAVRAAPGEVEGLSALAWVLATEPDAKFRDGRRAVVLAERAASLTGRQDARVLSILAAAYAESGRFDEAITTAESAQDLCAAAGQTERAGSIARKLALYRRNQPYHVTKRAGSLDPAQ